MRLVRLLRLLEATPAGLALEELARAYRVTTRTIRRDLAALACAREPVEQVEGLWRLVVTATATTEGEGR